MNIFILKIDREETLTAKLVAVAAAPNGVDNTAALERALNKESIFHGIDNGAIQTAFEKMHETAVGDEFIIARGEPAQPGKNGRIEFLRNVSGKPIYDGAIMSDADVGNLENVDFKNAMRIESVKVGDKIAIVHAPTLGVAGKALSGHTLPAHNGKPIVLQVGEGVALTDDGATAVATSEGRPVFDGRALTVSQTYDVNGDVCFDTGNIRFDGHVVIKGNVQDDFEIDARDVEVYGVIGAAKINCRGNFIAHGGVSGRNRAVIICAGSADGKYFGNCAKVEVRGDLNVAKEIANSTVWCRGTVRAGKIMGGEILALCGVEAKLFGAELGTPTLICPGLNYEVRRLDDTLKIFSQNISAIIRSIGTNFGDHRYFAGLAPEKQEELRKSYEKFCKLKTGHNKMTVARQNVLDHPDTNPNPVVAAIKLLHHDVTVKTTKCARRFIHDVKGPAKFVENIEQGTIEVKYYNGDLFAVDAPEETVAGSQSSVVSESGAASAAPTKSAESTRLSTESTTSTTETT